jgi:outer membrane protein insertion porin family
MSSRRIPGTRRCAGGPGTALLARAGLAALAILLAAALAAAQEAVKVVEIVFRGNRTYSTENLKYSMRTKEGRLLDRELLARDQSMLYEYFERVSLKEEPVEGGLRLVFSVEENRLVSRVDFLGVTRYPVEELRTLVDTRGGYPLAGFRVDNDVRRLERKYRDEGYHWIEVRAETLEDEGARRVVFRVIEGPEVVVDDVEFEGNDALGKGRLTPVMSQRPSKFLSPTPFVEGRLEEDRVALERLYHDEGFLDARVRILGVRFDDARDDATIRVRVEEGDPWTLGEVQVTGGEGLEDRARVVRPVERLVPGTRWLQKPLDRAVREMEDEARRQGFSDVRVRVRRIPRPEGKVQDVRFEIAEGERFTIRFLDVSGNALTQDKVILREFTVGPGDPLDTSAILKSVRRVLDLQYFGSVFPTFKPTDDPGRKDVEIRVDESARTRRAQFGVAVSSDTGVTGLLGLTLTNFDFRDWPADSADWLNGRFLTGAGQTLQIQLQPGSQISEYSLSFTEPWFLDRHVSVGFDLFARQERIFAYDVDSAGIHLRGRRTWVIPGVDLDDVYSVGLSPRYEVLDISGVDRDAPPNAFDLEGRNEIQAVTLDLRWSRFDQEFVTERGWRASLVSEMGGGPLGGDFDFWKNSAEVLRDLTLWRDLDERAYTLRLRAAGGLAMPLDDGKVPLPERFFAGGASGIGSNRAYAYTGLGPHGAGNPRRRPWRVLRSIERSHGNPMGGDAVASGTVEFGAPLLADVIRGAVFADAANLAFNTGDLREDWRFAAGFGILIKVPFLGQAPLRFDFGFPLNRFDGDERQVLHFNLTTFF